MTKKLKAILLGIMDGILPNVKNSITQKENEEREVNLARLMASILSFGLFVAFLKGWISLETIADFVKIFINGEIN